LGLKIGDAGAAGAAGWELGAEGEVPLPTTTWSFMGWARRVAPSWRWMSKAGMVKSPGRVGVRWKPMEDAVVTDPLTKEKLVELLVPRTLRPSTCGR